MAVPQGMLPAMRRLSAVSDFLIAGLIIAMVLIIVIPLPSAVLDLLLTFSIALSLVIFLSTMFVLRPLDFSVFPSLLLVVTLYRLALNISSTRLILGQGYAGRVIQSFGDFVVGGNYVVGFVVFLIITVIQFVVITNGAGRVAEVAARFTLDAMPGKQMSIDADLNGGLINEEEARSRRLQLQQEADFFGAMDGASKFVRGDAISGILIVLINILGGFVIGMWQQGMDAVTALRNYTLLTVGDGLVSQIPALLVSTATGILVTRAGSGENLSRGLARQLLAFPRVLGMVAFFLILLGLAPGLPHLPFLTLGGALGYASYLLSGEREREQARQAAAPAPAHAKGPENVLSLFQVDPLEIEIGYNLIPLTDESRGGDLLERLAAVRRQCAAEMGIFVKPVRIRDNLQLQPNAYCFKIRGVEVAGGELLLGQYLAMNPSEQPAEIKGTPTREPTFGLPAWWITPAEKEVAELKGLTIVDCATVLITHLTEFIRAHAAELLGRQETKELVEAVREQNAAVVEELMPDLLSVGEIQKVLQNLLKERVPIRDLATILETLADNARITKDLDYLTEAVRQALKRTITRQYLGEGKKLHAIMLHPGVEEAMLEVLQPTHQGSYPILAPEVLEKILGQLRHLAEQLALRGEQVVVLCSSRVRLPFKRLTERFLPALAVLAIQELLPDTEVEPAGTVVLD